MNVYGINVIIMIVLCMLPGIIYFIWFQMVGRKKAYLRFIKKRIIGTTIEDCQRLVKEFEDQNEAQIEHVKVNGMIAFNNDLDKFNHWLETPIPALDDKKPIDLLKSAEGIDLVNKELLRIEYSVY